MHGNTKLKFSDARQARDIYIYKNIKRKLYRTNTAIWYNKICRQKQLTPAYINIHIKGKNQQCQNTRRTANLYRINQDINSFMLKNRYRTHVPVAAVLVLNTPDDGRLRPKHVE